MSSKHWLAAYGARIPAEINPHAHRSVLDMLEGAMQRFADRPAFRCFGRTLTYADTDRLSREFAAYLQGRLGVKKGDRIAVMLPNIPAFALAMLGVVRAGAVQVNVNPLYTPRELEYQLNDAASRSSSSSAASPQPSLRSSARLRSSRSSVSAWATGPIARRATSSGTPGRVATNTTVSVGWTVCSA